MNDNRPGHEAEASALQIDRADQRQRTALGTPRLATAGTRRRREASRRLPVLACGRSDPWYYDALPLTDHQLDGWQATIAHLVAAGMTPIVPDAVLAALEEVAA